MLKTTRTGGYCLIYIINGFLFCTILFYNLLVNGDAHLGNFFLLQFLLIQQTRPTVTTSWVWLRYECVLEKGKLILLETTPYKLQYLAQWRISTSGNFHMLFTDALYGKGFFFHSVCTERVGGDLPWMLKKIYLY